MTRNSGSNHLIAVMNKLKLSICTNHNSHLLEFVELFQQGETDVRVDYYWSKGLPGKMYMSNGDPGYPEEYPEFDILDIIPMEPMKFVSEDGKYSLEIKAGEGIDWILSRNDMQEYEEKLMKELEALNEY